MMNPRLVAAGSAFLAMCACDASPRSAGDSATSIVSPAGVTVADSFPDEATESARIGAARSRVARRGLTLAFTVSAGRTVVITEDTIGGDGYQRYRYAGHLTGAPFHVVVVSYIEGRAVMLVHDSSGKQVMVDAIPIVSPDGQRFVTASMDLVAAFDPTRLAIWRPTGDSAQVEWQVEPNDWGPAEARWRGTDTVAFTRHRLGATPDTVHREPWYVARAPGGAWSLKAP